MLLLRLAKVVSGIFLEDSKMIIMGEFNIHAEAALGPAREFRLHDKHGSLSDGLWSNTPVRAHSWCVFTPSDMRDGLKIGGTQCTSLWWSDHYQVKFWLAVAGPHCRRAMWMAHPLEWWNQMCFSTLWGIFQWRKLVILPTYKMAIWNAKLPWSLMSRHGQTRHSICCGATPPIIPS